MGRIPGCYTKLRQKEYTEHLHHFIKGEQLQRAFDLLTAEDFDEAGIPGPLIACLRLEKGRITDFLENIRSVVDKITSGSFANSNPTERQFIVQTLVLVLITSTIRSLVELEPGLVSPDRKSDASTTWDSQPAGIGVIANERNRAERLVAFVQEHSAADLQQVFDLVSTLSPTLQVETIIALTAILASKHPRKILDFVLEDPEPIRGRPWRLLWRSSKRQRTHTRAYQCKYRPLQSTFWPYRNEIVCGLIPYMGGHQVEELRSLIWNSPFGLTDWDDKSLTALVVNYARTTSIDNALYLLRAWRPAPETIVTVLEITLSFVPETGADRILSEVISHYRLPVENTQGFYKALCRRFAELGLPDRAHNTLSQIDGPMARLNLHLELALTHGEPWETYLRHQLAADPDVDTIATRFAPPLFSLQIAPFLPLPLQIPAVTEALYAYGELRSSRDKEPVREWILTKLPTNLLEAIVDEAIKTGEPVPIDRLATRLPDVLLKRVFNAKLLPSDQVAVMAAAASRLTDAQLKRALALLAPPNPIQRTLGWHPRIPDRERAERLIAIIPYLPPHLLGEAVHLIETFDTPEQRVAVAIAILPLVPPPQKHSLATKITDDITAIRDETDRQSLQRQMTSLGVIDKLYGAERKARAEITQINDEADWLRAITRLTTRLSEAQRQRWIEPVFDANRIALSDEPESKPLLQELLTQLAMDLGPEHTITTIRQKYRPFVHDTYLRLVAEGLLVRNCQAYALPIIAELGPSLVRDRLLLKAAKSLEVIPASIVQECDAIRDRVLVQGPHHHWGSDEWELVQLVAPELVIPAGRLHLSAIERRYQAIRFDDYKQQEEMRGFAVLLPNLPDELLDEACSLAITLVTMHAREAWGFELEAVRQVAQRYLRSGYTTDGIKILRSIKYPDIQIMVMAEMLADIEDEIRIALANELYGSAEQIKDPSIRVSALAYIVPALPTVQHAPISADVIALTHTTKKINPLALARFAQQVTSSDKQALYARALELIEGKANIGERADAYHQIIPLLPPDLWNSAVIALIKLQPQLLGNIREIPERHRRTLLGELITWCGAVPEQQALKLWVDLCSFLMERPRHEVMTWVYLLVPLVEKLGGRDAIDALFGHLLDIGHWWPPKPTLNSSQRRDLVERLFNMRAEDVPLVQK